ncbi:hypothetical protein ABRP29_09080 [Pseudomonas sp. WHRI 8822A]|uniref:hypothetical protein n=1 Tax=Pseudomonas sp. WHRI 8822A TaxID=3162568 RepID=UPI0032EDCEC4
MFTSMAGHFVGQLDVVTDMLDVAQHDGLYAGLQALAQGLLELGHLFVDDDVQHDGLQVGGTALCGRVGQGRRCA